jgi:excisionase family DNA binding protein
MREKNELLTVSEVAAAVRLDPSTVRRLIAEGKIAAMRFTDGGAFRIARRELDRLLSGGNNTIADGDTFTLSDFGGPAPTRGRR